MVDATLPTYGRYCSEACAFTYRGDVGAAMYAQAQRSQEPVRAYARWQASRRNGSRER